MRNLSAAAALSLLLCVPAVSHAQDGVLFARPVPKHDMRALAVELRDQSSGPVQRFYSDRGYWPLWVEDGAIAPAALHFIGLLETSEIDGLKPEDYQPRLLRNFVFAASVGTYAEMARAEIALSGAFARYVRDIRRTSDKMRLLDEELRPGIMDDGQILRRAGLVSSFGDYVMQQGWMSPEYSALREALLQAQNGTTPAITGAIVPEGRLLRKGDRGQRVALLRQRLGLPDSDIFDDELAEAVTAYQQEIGLEADGFAGRQTIAALNYRPPEPDETLLRINLERARQLPGPWTRHVLVNAASGLLTWYEGGKEAGRMKVVVGTSETPTPMLAGMIRYATLNPYWNVPVDLARKTIAPAVRSGASLEAMGYEVLSDWTADAVVVDPATVDWAAVVEGKQQVRLRKLPGPANAMGKVKFMFPNDSGIYLHDTPSRKLFDEAARQFSNGCVRLEDAAELGRWFFGEDLEPRTGQPEEHRLLPSGVPVYITYLTAVPSTQGIRYLADVYDRDTEAFPPGSGQMGVDLGG